MDTEYFNIIGELIEKTKDFYERCTLEWLDRNPSFNTKRKEIRHIYKEQELLNVVLDFRNFMNEKAIEYYSIIPDIQNRNVKVNCRVKTYNSLLYKIETYMKKTDRNGDNLDGKISINKSLNDLFGMRIIIPSKFSHEELERYILNCFPELKIIDSTKNEYCASHIYFMYKNNKMFPWELQVWYSENEKSNLISHEKYKQGYTVWEKKFKEGGV